MTYYIVPLLVFYFGVVLCICYGGTSRLVLTICAIPIIAVACLRGHSGTDTAAYYTAFMGLNSGLDYGGEPLFKWFAEALWFVNPDPRFVVNLISLTTALLTLWGISRSRYGAWFGGLVIVPAMFYELTMNLLRFGLASSIFLLATQVPFEKKPVRYLVFAIVGTCFHFSSALLFILFVAATRRGQTLLIGIGALVIVGASFLMPAYMQDKVDLYTGMTAPNATSGLLFIILQLMLLGVMIAFRRNFEIPTASLWLCAILALALYAMTQFTYAGIRFQLILVYLMAVILFRRYKPENRRVSGHLTLCLLLIGLAGFGGRLHNMSDEEGRGDSPFLPYRTIPSLQEYR
ncbi:EpsG family protein [Paraburkholderia madseniana]|uniref:EpsG family protein n=1 Tax=Paraburkholderia madseniana TaxID=2599607 RepID=UPI0038B887AE